MSKLEIQLKDVDKDHIQSVKTHLSQALNANLTSLSYADGQLELHFRCASSSPFHAARRLCENHTCVSQAELYYLCATGEPQAALVGDG
jgi:hypothetical protein